MEAIPFFIFVVFPFGLAIFFISLAIYSVVRNKKARSNMLELGDYEAFSYNEKPRVGATVDRALYDEAWRYCEKHRITMSDLIRDALKSYIRSNK